jgi:hypothetical protein
MHNSEFTLFFILSVPGTLMVKPQWLRPHLDRPIVNIRHQQLPQPTIV